MEEEAQERMLTVQKRAESAVSNLPPQDDPQTVTGQKRKRKKTIGIVGKGRMERSREEGKSKKDQQ